LLTSGKFIGWIPNIESLVKLRTPTPTPPPAAANANFEPAPDVEFQTLAGTPLRLKDLHGQVVLLNFWATWCLPCREEIPELNALQHELEAKGLKVIGASTEDSIDGVNSYQESVAKFEYQVLIGGNDAKAKLEHPQLPTTYLIDRQGRIRQKVVGARDKAGWEAFVKPLLEEAPATASAAN
jgi:thiol-disulfide isomerase/thioredoxin